MSDPGNEDDGFAGWLDARVGLGDAERERLEALTGLPLRQAAYAAEDALASFDQLIFAMHDADFALAEALETLDPGVIVEDREWRALFDRLGREQPPNAARQALALVKYRHYLKNRNEFLARRIAGTSGASTPRGEMALVPQEASEAPPPRSAAASRSGGPQPLARLPRGKAIALEVAAGAAFGVWLGKHAFRLRGGESATLVSALGARWRLRPGVTMVGRGSLCDVVLGDGYRTVSRVHLRILIADDAPPTLTDLSSGGTFVRLHVLSEAARNQCSLLSVQR